MDSNNLKQKLYDLGADFCGIAPIDRFKEAPEGFNPVDTLPSCKSVIVFGKKFPRGTLDCINTIPYTIARNMLSDTLDKMSVSFCALMEDKNIIAVPVGAVGPAVLDKKTNRSRGIVSLKHAAVMAGLGYFGKNTLVITPDYGNMVWFSAVLANIELEPDNIINKNCPEDCLLCVKSCPVNALKEDSLEMDQMKCFGHSFRTNQGESFYLKCNKCRTICPNCLGSKNK